MSTRQKASLAILALLVLLAFGWPWTAKAHTVDQEFLADLTANGITVNNEAGTVDYAQWVCKGLELGTNLYAMRDSVQRSQDSFTVENAEEFIGASVNYYCPWLIPDAGGPVVAR